MAWLQQYGWDGVTSSVWCGVAGVGRFARPQQEAPLPARRWGLEDSTPATLFTLSPSREALDVSGRNTQTGVLT